MHAFWPDSVQTSALMPHQLLEAHLAINFTAANSGESCNHRYDSCHNAAIKNHLHLFNHFTPSGSQKDLAYSSVAHMNFITIGLFSYNTQGVEGSVMLMVKVQEELGLLQINLVSKLIRNQQNMSQF